MKFKKNKITKSFLQKILIGSALVVATFGILLSNSGQTLAQSSTATSSIKGWAWSSNIGWISMHDTTYGVDIDNTTGNINGYAWSQNIGWIKFGGLATAQTNNGFPVAAGTNPVDAKVSGDKIIGWARACTGFQLASACSGTSRTDGWDGWISLSGTTAKGTSYGVIISTSTSAMSGLAWGSTVIGWVGFSKATSTYFISQLPPITANLMFTWYASSTGGYDAVTWSSTGADKCVLYNGTSSIFPAYTPPQSSTPYNIDMLSGTTIFNLVCTNNASGLSATSTRTITVSPFPVVSFTLPAYTTTSLNPSVSISYFSAGVTAGCVPTSVPVDNTWNTTSITPNTTGAFIAQPSVTTKYILTCSNAVGTTTASTTVTVTGTTPPSTAVSVSLSASSSSVPYAGTSTLSWSSENAVTCNATAVPATSVWDIGTATTSGSMELGGLSTTTTFTLMCTNNSLTPKTYSTSTKIIVAPLPIVIQPVSGVTCSATPGLDIGVQSLLSWTSLDANSCSASWTSSNATSGSQTVTPSSTTTYTILCSNNKPSSQTAVCPTASGSNGGGSCGGSPCPPQPTVVPTATLTALPSAITAGNSTTLSWVSNGDSCSASWTSSTAPISTQSVSPAVTTTYAITCTNAVGPYSTSTTVTVSPVALPPFLSISAALTSTSPATTSVFYNQQTTISWDVENITSPDCTIMEGGLTPNPLIHLTATGTGNVSSGHLTSGVGTQFTLICGALSTSTIVYLKTLSQSTFCYDDDNLNNHLFQYQLTTLNLSLPSNILPPAGSYSISTLWQGAIPEYDLQTSCFNSDTPNDCSQTRYLAPYPSNRLISNTNYFEGAFFGTGTHEYNATSTITTGGFPIYVYYCSKASVFVQQGE